MVGDIKEMQQLHTENAPTFYHFETLDLLCARCHASSADWIAELLALQLAKVA